MENIKTTKNQTKKKGKKIKKKKIKLTPLFFNIALWILLLQPLHGQSVITFNTAVSLSQKSDHKKLDKKNGKKIDKNDTFILQDRPVNHIVAKNQQQLL